MPDVQALLKRSRSGRIMKYTELYPRRMPAKIIVRMQDGNVIEHEVRDYPGLATHPVYMGRRGPKFDTLVAGRVDEGAIRRD